MCPSNLLLFGLFLRADSLESREFDPDGTRGHGGFLRQNSLREWDIPFNELDVGTVIGMRLLELGSGSDLFGMWEWLSK